MCNKERNAYMDFLKGIAMVAVIVGHSVADVSQSKVFFHVIYSFHMPLLMFISAYIEETNREKYITNEGTMLYKRFCGLLIPYMSWSILYRIVSGNLLEINIKDFVLWLFGYEQGGLWFLPVLFGLKILHFLYWKIEKRIKKADNSCIVDMLICCALEFVTAILAFLTKQPYIINMLSYAVPYFFAIIIVDNEVFRKVIDSEWTAAGVMVVYLLLFPKFSFGNTHWMTQVIRIGLSLCVIIICYRFRKKWEMNQYNKIVCMFGKYSLAIYVLHGYFLDYTLYLDMFQSAFMIAVLSIFAAFIIALVCVAIARIIEISSWWGKILFGK